MMVVRNKNEEKGGPSAHGFVRGKVATKANISLVDLRRSPINNTKNE
jgi:hypothetical protein